MRRKREGGRRGMFKWIVFKFSKRKIQECKKNSQNAIYLNC